MEKVAQISEYICIKIKRNKNINKTELPDSKNRQSLERFQSTCGLLTVVRMFPLVLRPGSHKKFKITKKKEKIKQLQNAKNVPAGTHGPLTLISWNKGISHPSHPQRTVPIFQPLIALQHPLHWDIHVQWHQQELCLFLRYFNCISLLLRYNNNEHFKD